MQVYLDTLGCRLNEAEIESWSSQLMAAGHELTRQPEDAGLIVLNSCAVTQDAVRKSRGLMRQLQRRNPSAKLVLSGCYATLHEDEAQTLGVDLVLENQGKSDFMSRIQPLLDDPALPMFATDPAEEPHLAMGRQRAFVKVQDGCRYRCSFCIVTLARGAERSQPLHQLVAEVQGLADAGLMECVLTGVHLGGYGSDIGSDLGDLVNTILQKTSIKRLRLGSLEPWDLPEDFWSLFADGRLMPHLHLPMQSGSNSVLRRMARRCHTEEFKALAEEGRRRVPGIHLSTDIMVGFPGETEVEFNDTCEFVAQVGFGDVHLFTYSPRPGTRAAAMPDQIHGTVKKARLTHLREIAAQTRSRALATSVGREVEVLWENPRHGRSTGYTPDYFRVFDDRPHESNTLSWVRIKGVSEDGNSLTVQGDLLHRQGRLGI